MKGRIRLSLAILLAASAAHAQEGALDPTFGILSSGRVVYGHDVPANLNDTPQALVVDAQGNSYTLGRSLDETGTKWRASVAKLTAAGVLDTGFGGGDGKITTTDIEGSFWATDIARDSIGQLVVAGSRVFGDIALGDRDFLVCRFNTGGTPIDFGPPTNNHCRSIFFDIAGSNRDQLNVLKIAPDGSMYLVGFAESSPGLATASIAVVKLTSTGALDTSFSGDGKALFNLPVSSVFLINDAVVAADGSLYLGGFEELGNDKDALAVKLTPNGALDPAFGGDGFQNYAFDLGAVGFRDDVANAIDLTADGKLLLGGTAQVTADTESGFLLRAFANTASQDIDFGNGSRLLFGGNGPIVDLISQSPTRTLYARSINQSGALRFRVGRATESGNDVAFGAGGVTDINFGFAQATDVPKEIAVSAGRVIVMGSVRRSATDFDFGVARLRGDAMFADRFE